MSINFNQVPDTVELEAEKKPSLMTVGEMIRIKIEEKESVMFPLSQFQRPIKNPIERGSNEFEEPTQSPVFLPLVSITPKLAMSQKPTKRKSPSALLTNKRSKLKSKHSEENEEPIITPDLPSTSRMALNNKIDKTSKTDIDLKESKACTSFKKSLADMNDYLPHTSPTDVPNEGEKSLTSPTDVPNEGEKSHTSPTDVPKEVEKSHTSLTDVPNEGEKSLTSPTDVPKEVEKSHTSPTDVSKKVETPTDKEFDITFEKLFGIKREKFIGRLKNRPMIDYSPIKIYLEGGGVMKKDGKNKKTAQNSINIVAEHFKTPKCFINGNKTVSEQIKNPYENDNEIISSLEPEYGNLSDMDVIEKIKDMERMGKKMEVVGEHAEFRNILRRSEYKYLEYNHEDLSVKRKKRKYLSPDFAKLELPNKVENVEIDENMLASMYPQPEMPQGSSVINIRKPMTLYLNKDIYSENKRLTGGMDREERTKPPSMSPYSIPKSLTTEPKLRKKISKTVQNIMANEIENVLKENKKLPKPYTVNDVKRAAGIKMKKAAEFEFDKRMKKLLKEDCVLKEFEKLKNTVGRKSKSNVEQEITDEIHKQYTDQKLKYKTMIDEEIEKVLSEYKPDNKPRKRTFKNTETPTKPLRAERFSTAENLFKPQTIEKSFEIVRTDGRLKVTANYKVTQGTKMTKLPKGFPTF